MMRTRRGAAIAGPRILPRSEEEEDDEEVVVVVSAGSEGEAVTWRVWTEVNRDGVPPGVVGDCVDVRVVTRELVSRFVVSTVSAAVRSDGEGDSESSEAEEVGESEASLEEDEDESDEPPPRPPRPPPLPPRPPPLRGICLLLLSILKRSLLVSQQGWGGSTRLPSQQNSPGSHS